MTMPDETGGWGRTLGLAVRLRRQERRLTLTRLAEMVGVSKSYLSEIETGRRSSPPSESVLRDIESLLQLAGEPLLAIARGARTPEPVREELSSRRAAVARLKAVLGEHGNDLDALRATGELDRLVADLDPLGSPGPGAANALPVSLEQRVPLINKVRAGQPTEYTDLGLPAGVADEYVSCGDLSDPDAFAARLVGDSMAPAYGEGDVVVFSPLKPVRSGSDCFVRLEPDQESTFKRVYFEAGEDGRERVRLQPLNDRYPAKTVDRERVAGLFAAARVIREIG